MSAVKVEKMKRPITKNSQYPFDTMKVGDSFYYEGSRSSVISQFSYWAAKGCYSVRKEGNGWRFYLLEDPKKGR